MKRVRVVLAAIALVVCCVVVAAPCAAGRWFFRIDEDTPGARVYRID